ncbi:MAG: HD domain-containing protein [SAR324 cluster bacterium]|nr:HD domain-containing protein [SAR324 cluster bacterium]
MTTISLHIPSEATKIAEAIAQKGGQAFLVGGTVRDHFLSGNRPKDLDIEVFHLASETLESLLANFGSVHLVGKQFGVFKLTSPKENYDISLPRRENKTGKGHRGFFVEADPEMNFEEAALRRDFTINAMGYDILGKTFIDPFHGQEDLENKILRHVGPRFIEDPLRVLRAMQFAGRFSFQIAPETVELCRGLDLNELPKERLFEEFKKLLLKADRPSLGLEAAKMLGVLEYFPELEALINVPQDPQWHPEGDVWTHNGMVIDEAAKLRDGNEQQDLCLMFGALCHDFGKPPTTELKEGRWRSIGHCEAGIAPAEQFLRRMTEENALIETVKTLVAEHLRPAYLYGDRGQITEGAIRRLSLRVSIPLLVKVAQADHFGRTTPDAIAREFPAGEWLLEQAEVLKVRDRQPAPILMGRHLISLGMKPGPEMGQILKIAFELQLDGKIAALDQALTWAEQKLFEGPVNNSMENSENLKGRFSAPARPEEMNTDSSHEIGSPGLKYACRNCGQSIENVPYCMFCGTKQDNLIPQNDFTALQVPWHGDDSESLRRIPFGDQIEQKIERKSKWMKFVAFVHYFVAAGLGMTALIGGISGEILFRIIFLIIAGILFYEGRVLWKASNYFRLVAVTDEADQIYIAEGAEQLKAFFLLDSIFYGVILILVFFLERLGNG